MEIKVTDAVSEQDKNEIRQGLIKYNLLHLENKDVRELGIFIEDEQGEKTAGLVGETHGNWLEIEYLWVSEVLRGQGIGTRLIEKAEQVAKERGCQYAFLNTFSFQAPEFYKKLGYKEIFALENYPVTGKKFYFLKAL